VFFSSEAFGVEVRKVDQKVDVTNSSIDKVAFDFEHWKRLRRRNIRTACQSLFPTIQLSAFQWPSEGFDQPLHVAVARLLGYKWPRQTGSSFPDCPALGPDGLEAFANSDGIVCLPPVNREQPAQPSPPASRRCPRRPGRTLSDRRSRTQGANPNLEDWLRDEFFEQHAKLFTTARSSGISGWPFDGFHALVNYHKLDNAALKKLTYSYLGDWIQQQDIDAKADKPSAAERLGAARALQAKLAAILEARLRSTSSCAGSQSKIKPRLESRPQRRHPSEYPPIPARRDVGKRGAGLFRTVPLKLKDDDRGTEPHRPKEEYPWFYCEDEPGSDPDVGKEFVANVGITST